LAYAVDYSMLGTGGFDLLGITPAILLSGLIVTQLYMQSARGEKLCSDRTRFLLMIFVVLCLFSILLPTNSIIVGLGGVERNILPNMMILFLAAAVFTNALEAEKLLKAMLVLGLISCLYAIGQYILGIYPWEKVWIREVAFKESCDGWLIIGLRGIEFRIFSIFFSYVDFTFTNTLIFSLVFAMNRRFRGV